MSQPKFCAKCGNALSENEKFCAKCGNPVAAAEEAPQTAPAEAVNETAPAADNGTVFTAPVPPPVEESPVPAAKVQGGINIAKYKVPIIIGAVALVAVIAVVVVLMSLPKYQKIDAKDLFHISFKGVNTQGTAVAYLNCEEAAQAADYDRYYKLHKAEANDEELEDDDGYSPYFSDEKKELLKAYDTAKDKSDATAMRKVLLKQSKKDGSYVLKVKFDKSSGLSNGDKVKCTVDFDEDDMKEAKIQLENTEFEVEVEGLLDGTKLDYFDGFEISFEGQNESGKAVYSSYNEKYPFIEYTLSSRNYLTNGDSIEVTANMRASRVQDFTYFDPEDRSKGAYFTYNDTIYIVEDTTATKSYTVSGLTDLEEIDIFKGIKFRTTGATPYLRISSVDRDDCEDVIKNYVYFSIDGDAENLKVGDTFKVKASVSLSSLKNQGYKPNVELDDSGYAYKEFTVDDSYGAYITNESDPADVDKLEEEFKPHLEQFEDRSKGKTSISGSNIKFDGKIESFAYETYKNYIIMPEGFAEGTISTYDPKNILFRVYKVKITARDDDDKTTSKTVYLAYRFTGAYIDANGEGKLASNVSSYTVAEKPEDLQKFYDRDEKYGKAVEVGKAAPAPEPEEPAKDDSSKDDSSDDESKGGDEEPEKKPDDSSKDDSSKDDSSED